MNKETREILLDFMCGDCIGIVEEFLTEKCNKCNKKKLCEKMENVRVILYNDKYILRICDECVEQSGNLHKCYLCKTLHIRYDLEDKLNDKYLMICSECLDRELTGIIDDLLKQVVEYNFDEV